MCGMAERARRWGSRVLAGAGMVVGAVLVLLGAGFVALSVNSFGTPSPTAHGTGHDAEWLGHAWVDGRKGQSDVDALARELRPAGPAGASAGRITISDLFVHTGPFRNDGTLDPALRPKARWLVDALHAALPGVRVQAWLGAHPTPGALQLDSATTRANLVASVGQVLDDGFDGVQYDFEPLDDGNQDLVTLLHTTHELTQQRHKVLSLSASHTEPLPGIVAAVRLAPGPLALWSNGYLHRLALELDQVALMVYDTGLPTRDSYAGYTRQVTERALAAVPADVALFIGVPAYHDDNLDHHADAEVIPAALRGVRLALGDRAPRQNFGVALYVDFTATPADWASYHHDWADPAGTANG